MSVCAKGYHYELLSKDLGESRLMVVFSNGLHNVPSFTGSSQALTGSNTVCKVRHPHCLNLVHVCA